MKKIWAPMIMLLCGFSTHALAQSNVYTWKDGAKSTYSDVPKSLQTDGTSKMNVRTHQITPLTEAKTVEDDSSMSLAEKQSKLNQEIAENNKKILEENKLREKASQEANCKAAQFNQQTAQSSRAQNKDELIKRYNEDVQRYCK